MKTWHATDNKDTGEPGIKMRCIAQLFNSVSIAMHVEWSEASLPAL